jgi:hypothetical protein
VVKVSKKQEPPQFSKTIRVTDTISVQVIKQGEKYAVIYNKKKIAEAGGHFEAWCFEVEDYIVCLDRNEIEVG